MSGNLWMFSDMLDDEDIEMQKHDFITLSRRRLLWTRPEGVYTYGT